MDDLELSFKANINLISRELRKDSLSVKNRLQSILYDAKYIESLESEYPLIPNERCGLWYVPLDKQDESCYFKSTDGHTGQWSFSLRRLNLHLVQLIQANGGLCIVDSTRKGKKIPDALLKTIPIWCAVLNYIKFGAPSEDAEDNWLRTPAVMISKSEHSQIASRIPKFAAEAVESGIVTPEKLKDLCKPLVPTWYYPGGKSKPNGGSSASSCGSNVIQCVTASKQIKLVGSTMSIPGNSWYYVQGSADDHELWATSNICKGKLDAIFFWRHLANSSDIVGGDGFIHNWLSEEQLISKMNEIYDLSQSDMTERVLDVTKVKDTGIYFGKIELDVSYERLNSYDVQSIVVLSEKSTIINVPEKPDKLLFQYQIESSKKGSKQLRELLPELMGTIASGPVLIVCDTGKDLSVGIVLVLLCLNYDLNWERVKEKNKVDKTLVKQQLGTLLDCRKINPSRNTLQSINTYMMK